MLETALINRLEKLTARAAALEEQLQDPTVLADAPSYLRLAKEHGRLSKLVARFERWQHLVHQLDETQAVLHDRNADQELAQLARDELPELEQAETEIADELRGLLLEAQTDPDRNVIIEIRAGTGGDEAGLFAADLFRMYARYAEKRSWKVEIMSQSVTDLQGFKEIIFSISGPGAYRRLAYESGGHRVQRVPVTETSGRIHTSAVTVAVLPEAKDVDIAVRQDDLEIDRYRSSGPGGQNVNKVSSAIRILHKPTGLLVTCQDEQSQHKNLAKAMRILRTRLYDAERRRQEEERGSLRRQLIGTGDRSDRIRTYNFPQNRVTDHRINLTLYHLQEVMLGDLDEVTDALISHDREEQLKQLQEE